MHHHSGQWFQWCAAWSCYFDNKQQNYFVDSNTIVLSPNCGVKTQVRGYTFEQYGLWVLVAVMVLRNTKCVFQCVCAVQVCQVAGKWFMFVLLSRAQWEGLLRCLKRSDEVIDILRMRRKLFWSSSVTFWKYRKTINHPDLCFHSGKRLKDRKQRQEEQRKVTSVITVHPPSLWIIW